MGGKKKAGGKKKGGKKGGDDDGEIDPAVLNDILTAKVMSLKARLVLEQERRDNADCNIDAIREEGITMTDTMGEDKGRTREMVTKMTSIYKNMEKMHNTKIEEDETQVEEQDRTKKALKEEIQQLQQSKEEMMTSYEQSIFKLKERIDTMSSDFAKMLKTTLKKMQERIDDANQTYEGDQPGNGDGAAAGAFDGTPGM